MIDSAKPFACTIPSRILTDSISLTYFAFICSRRIEDLSVYTEPSSSVISASFWLPKNFFYSVVSAVFPFYTSLQSIVTVIVRDGPRYAADGKM
jgi:hypothetical protein